MNISEHILKHKSLILKAERWLWAHPQTGYREWDAHGYMASAFEELGYEIKPAGNIPGFTVDIEISEGPRILILAELDSLICSEHPESAKDTGYVHACGHHAQMAAILGLAAALKNPEVSELWNGSIRLCVVPAEELIETDYRIDLIDQGIIKYPAGKVEFLRRGYFDDCDIAFMCHTTAGSGISCSYGGNGAILKRAEFIGKACHASAPHDGINALYMAQLGMTAANAIRETFIDSQHIRYHPIITHGGQAVNAIPSNVQTESYIRGADFNVLKATNIKINRAVAASAAAMGGNVKISDRLGFAPLINNKGLISVMDEARKMLIPGASGSACDGWDMGCTDMGDLSGIIPSIHFFCGGASGTAHGKDYKIEDPYLACLGSASVQLYMLDLLLKDGAKRTKEIIANSDTLFKNKDEYFRTVESFELAKEAVIYNENGTVTLSFC
jgi:amidohydrolase